MPYIASYQRRQPLRQGSELDLPVRRHKPDYGLLVITTLLLAIGLIVVYSISPGLSAAGHVSSNYYISKQVIAIVLGLTSFTIAANISLSYWRKIRLPLLIVAAVVSVAVRLFGRQINGAYRWVQIGGFSFQAVELVKFALLIWLAYFLAERLYQGNLNSTSKTIRPLIIMLLAIGVVVTKMQSDLGSTGVLVVMIAAMCYIAGLPLRRVMLFAGIIVIGVFLAISSSAYRRDRVLTFLQPQRDCLSTGYQACQALITVGSGGLYGKGFAGSVQAYGYLPEAANDSIFAIIAEKFGFIGVTLLISLFAVLFARLKSIMQRAPNNVTKLIMAGILAWFSTQTIINIGAMIGLLPLKGITLPFISYGGTSIIFVTAVIGLAFNISHYTNFAEREVAVEGRKLENRFDRRRDRRTFNAVNRYRS